MNTATIQIFSETLALISEIDEFKGAWRAMGTLAPERLGALRRVATIESIGSSTRIEGSRLSDREVERLLANLDVKSLSSRDEQEVAGYAEAMETVFQSWTEIAITENHIKQLHRDLLRYSSPRYSSNDERHRGEYKKLPNNVVAFDENGREIGTVFATASPFETPRLMAEFVAWLADARSTRLLHPLLIIAIFTVVFLEIHPFQDGNGRLSGILTTLLLLQAGYAYVPYSSLESVIETSKESYYLALRQTQRTIRTADPDWQPWLLYFLRSLQQQKRRLAAKIEREQLLLAALPGLALKIVDQARQHGRVTIGEMIRLTGASRNTLKQEDFIQSVADALQYISYYHPVDYITNLARAYEREQSHAAKDAIAQILINSPHVRRGPSPHLPGHRHRHRLRQGRHGCPLGRRHHDDVHAADGRRRRPPRLPRPRQQAPRLDPRRPRRQAQEHRRQHPRRGQLELVKGDKSTSPSPPKAAAPRPNPSSPCSTPPTPSSTGCSRPSPPWAPAGARPACSASASAAPPKRPC
jgi:Fic family protein